MADLRNIRQKRLENEYRELMSINGPIIKIEPLGNPPYEKYKITYNIGTIISPSPTCRNQTVCMLTIPTAYGKLFFSIQIFFESGCKLSRSYPRC